MIELAAGLARATVDDEAGGRLASLRVGEVELLVTRRPGSRPTQWGCFPMAPWAGRLRQGRLAWQGEVHQLAVNHPPHAIHGTVFDRSWEVGRATGTEVTLTADLGPGWPWPGRVVHRLAMLPDRLDLELRVEAATEPFPASCGWHPWFRRPVALDLVAGRLWVKGSDDIPTGELVPAPASLDGLDDCLTDVRRAPVLRWPEGVEARVETDCVHLVVFTQPEHALCVEPQTGPPDAPNQQPVVVRPDEPLVARASLVWA